MGDEEDDIFSSFSLAEDDKNKYDAVKQAFENHFIKKRNPIFERAKFNQRKQEEGESVDTFVTALHTLVKHCEYGALQDQMIRDRLVVGLRDAVLSEKLQMEPNLSPEKAVSYACQREAVKKQQSVVRGKTQSNVDADKAHYHHKAHPQAKKGQAKSLLTGRAPKRSALGVAKRLLTTVRAALHVMPSVTEARIEAASNHNAIPRLSIPL